jgi:hypothetical protein
VSPQRLVALDLVAVTRFDEVRAHEEENDLRRLEPYVDLASPFAARGNHTVVPLQNPTIALEYDELAPYVIH